VHVVVNLPNNTNKQKIFIIYLSQKDRNSASNEIEIRGDNTFNSTDSRDYGPVPIGLIQYKTVYRLYPLERRGRIIEYN